MRRDEQTRNSCFKQLIVGHEASLSLKGLYHHRALSVRALRAVLHDAYGVAAPPLRAHAIVVLEKNCAFQLSRYPGPLRASA
jgi:hypothetical protein